MAGLRFAFFCCFFATAFWAEAFNPVCVPARSTAGARHAARPLVLRDAPARSSPAALEGGGLERALDPVKWSAPVAVATAAITICTKSIHDWYFSDEKRFSRLACNAKISPQILDKSAMPYVARAQADAALGAFVATPGKFICIVVGPRGVGKTTTVAHALEHIDGVIMVKVTGEHTRDTLIYAEIAKEVLGAPSSSTDALSNKQIVRYFEATASRYIRQHPHAADWKPTVVFELESNAQPATVSLAVQTMKILVCDRAVCRGFVVLSDAHGIYAIASDTNRHRYFWLADFSSAEADVFLDELGALTAADQRALRAEVYAQASTRAIDLSKLADELNLAKGAPTQDVVRAFIDRQQMNGLTRVENLIGVAEEAAKAKYGMRGLHFIRLMKAMLENGGSLPVLDADYMCPEAGIADVLKLLEHHAILINKQTALFTFNTPADRIAAEQTLGKYDGHDDGFKSTPP